MFKWHKEPLQSLLWFEGVYPEEYAYILKEKNIIEHSVDYEKILKRLMKG